MTSFEKIMTQEHKELLLKDLCARLPYGIKVHRLGNHKHNLYKCEVIDAVNYEMCITSQGPYMDNCPFMTKYVEIDEVRPYLFPMSNMTEEQKKEFDQLLELELKAINDEIDHIQATIFEVDFYNKHHFDWRSLIPLGLANDATGLNIY